ncbi:hypothetical protein JO379_001279 [Streptomyces syringium]|uniref:JmjC domain-containing protein n=1 Tax=Streptomyces syringium TaxID=76729 RepID=A0ABS4XZS3_9ACTN|nr:hypothetical protein [Streptomyces syringium]
MYRDSAPNSEPGDEIVWQGVMEPGDVMHIPRGFWHQATRDDQGDGYSLHATFGIVKRVGVNWLAWLTDQARTQKLFRCDLDRWNSVGQWEGQQQLLAKAVAEMAAKLTPQGFLDARERERPAARHVPATGLFGKPAAVVCVTDFEPVIQQHRDTVDVLAAGKKLTFAGKAYPALTLLLSGHPVDICDTAEKTGVDVEQLAEILLKEELCTELTPALSSAYTGLVTIATS